MQAVPTPIEAAGSLSDHDGHEEEGGARRRLFMKGGVRLEDLHFLCLPPSCPPNGSWQSSWLLRGSAAAKATRYCMVVLATNAAATGRRDIAQEQLELKQKGSSLVCRP